MFMVEMKAAPGRHNNPNCCAGREWEFVGIGHYDSTVDTIEEGIACIRELWEFDREGAGNIISYRLRRLADDFSVFTKMGM